jgi:hypothetical protein
VGFQHKEEAERFIEDLRERFAKLGLELHSEKTRLIEFGPWAAENRRRKGQGKPQRFEFLGFRHICGRKRSNGYFTVYRQSMRKRLQVARLIDRYLPKPRIYHDDPLRRLGVIT